MIDADLLIRLHYRSLLNNKLSDQEFAKDVPPSIIEALKNLRLATYRFDKEFLDLCAKNPKTMQDLAEGRVI